MPSDSERIAELERIVTELQAVIGNYQVRADMANRPAELPNGEYPIMFRQRQLGLGTDDAVANAKAALAKVAELEPRLAAVEARPAQQSSSGTVLPLVPASGTAVREMRDLAAAKANGHIVPFNADGLLLQVDQVHHGNHAFPGKVAVGTDNVLDVDADLQVSGGGEILFHTRVPEAKTQEKNGDRTRLGVVSFSPYDNGVRFIRGAVWRNGIMQHNPDDPTVHILSMDSQGTVGKSTEEYSSGTTERCQLWIVREDHENKEIVFVPCRAGWGFRVAASTRTTNMNNEQNFNRAAQIIAPLPGAV